MGIQDVKAESFLGKLEVSFNQKKIQFEKNNFVKRLWQKDASLWKTNPEHVKIIDQSLGWLRVTEKMRAQLKEIEDFAQEVKQAQFANIVLLGMGGSSLAPEVMRLILPSAKGAPKLFVLDSTDPEWIAKIDRAVSGKKTLYIFASKSGTTVEPFSFYRYFFSRVKEDGDCFVAITDPGTFLEKLAKEKKFRKTFVNPSDIGGRFSALSLFGLVPAALAGKNIRAMLESAELMMTACQNSVSENPGVELGLAMGTAALYGRDKLTVVLPKNWSSLGLWIEQLVAESSGKEGRGIVPIAGEELLPVAAYGSDRLFVVYALGGKLDAKMQKWVKSIRAKHPLIILPLGKKESLAGEFFRWEIATSAACAVLGVNTYDQPNVQEAKTLARAALEELSCGKLAKLPVHAEGKKFQLSFSQVAAAAAKQSQPQAALQTFLRLAKTSDYWGILAFTPEIAGLEKNLLQFRSRLLKKTKLATLFGYGPRYLHSTGQLHKGGAANGLYFVICSENKKDLPVPGESYTFAQLKNAQALGDFKALDTKKRRAVFVSLTGPVESAFQEFLCASIKK